ncbi:hypothetical protein SAMN05421869_13698 [Nonomuraea jiangxiensis]|uniref:Uncharacterized protein n=1 Tax=Nonomuraea jiangxiensis TaxID=633440 RepID=A0A1G9QNB8_9ACTN|nr:hypothetical protein SAMN05421869_13698 [Nonomuraea jiangxiensis]
MALSQLRLYGYTLGRGGTAADRSTIMVCVAMLRLLAIGLLGGVVAVPFLWVQRGDGFEYARFAALMALDLGQLVTVPVELGIGFVLAVMGLWTRTPGYVLGVVTAVFGVFVAGQAWPTMRWVDGRPSGFGDPDGEFVMVVLALASGVVTTLVGFSIVLFRWSGYDPSERQTPGPT